jgi:riboflavin synthase
MFSGIVEAVGQVQSVRALSKAFQIDIEKPSDFNDLSIGDSVAVNGVCLTVEAFDPTKVTFTLADETLKVTGWTPENLLHRRFNLERSLRLGDRIHGHLVAGHVDAVGKVEERAEEGASLWYWISFPENMAPLLWKKGSVSLQGVSLTINEIKGSQLSLCLIPETLRRTNLGDLKIGDQVNLEADSMARAMVHFAKTEGKKLWN